MVFALFSSCNDDDNSAESYVGTWIATTEETTDCTDARDNSFQMLSCTDVDCFRLTLNGDGTYSFQEGLPTEVGTWSASGRTLSLCTENDGEQTCRFSTGIFQGAGLLFSISDEDTGCTTMYTMEREVTTN